MAKKSVFLNIALVLCSLIALPELVYNIRSSFKQTPGNDEAGLFEKKYSCFPDEIRKTGFAGYVSGSTRADLTREYYLAQYALAPAVVVNSRNYDLVIYKFNDSTGALAPYFAKRYGILADCGGGLVVLKKKKC